MIETCNININRVEIQKNAASGPWCRTNQASSSCPDWVAMTKVAIQPAAVVIDTLDTGSAYAEGLHAFWNSDYKTAADIFENLLRRQEDESFRSQALYGLACARLAGASIGKHRILNGIGLDLAPGRWVAVVGPNGAGKSTLLRVLAGLT